MNAFDRQISFILRHGWNPIGFDDVLPEDEYVYYVPELSALLKSDASVEVIAETLHVFRTEHIGLNSDSEGDYKAAVMLQELLRGDKYGCSDTEGADEQQEE